MIHARASVLVALLGLACASGEDGYGPLFGSSGSLEAGDGDGDPSTTGDGDPSTTGDGDGDPTTTGDGDGDGDPSTTGDGDGDGDPTGDGDGDPTTGDGDGDGDGDPDPCAADNNDVLCLACGKLNCCDELIACNADVDCSCIKDCFLGGDTVQNCAAICAAQPNANPPFMAVAACVQSSCAAECL